MIQLQILDPTKETDPERKEEAINRNNAILQVQQVMHNNNLSLHAAWEVLANVARFYLQENPENQWPSWINIFLAIAKEPILCTDCMMEEAEQATKQ